MSQARIYETKKSRKPQEAINESLQEAINGVELP